MLPYMAKRGEVTRLVRRFAEGERDALERLLPLVYDELHQLAQRQLKGRGSVTLDTTVLVHEAYLKLADQDAGTWEDRSQFLRVCAVVMRHLIIDFARRRSAAKRGGGAINLELEENTARIDAQVEELLALDQALDRLEEYDARLARIVECRYFTGLSEAETAEALGLSERTVRRDWVKARALLHQLLSDVD